VRRDKGQHTAQKMEGKGVPVDFCTGGVRGSDKRGTGGHRPRRRQPWTNRRHRDEQGQLSTFVVLRALVKGMGGSGRNTWSGRAFLFLLMHLPCLRVGAPSASSLPPWRKHACPSTV
jgi:hypothetical protein